MFFTQLAGAVIGDEMFGMRCYEAAVSAYSLALRSTANATLVVPRDALCRWHFQRGRCFLLLRRNELALSDFTTVRPSSRVAALRSVAIPIARC